MIRLCDVFLRVNFVTEGTEGTQRPQRKNVFCLTL
jgi:hypothetical protein